MNKQDFEKYADIKPFNDTANPVWARLCQRYLQIRKNDLPGLKVLDYGCGDGKLLQHLYNYGITKENIYGHEVSQKRVQRCHEKGWTNIIHVDLHKKLPFEDRMFDFIHLMEVIEHIPSKETDFYIEDMRRMMRDDGVLFVTTPNYPVKRFNDFFEVVINKRWKRIFDDPTHVTFYTARSLHRRLRKFFPHVEVLCYKKGVFYPRIKHPTAMHKIIAIASASPIPRALLEGEDNALPDGLYDCP